MKALTLRDPPLLATGFNPLTQVTALHAGWASDPLWLNGGVPWANLDPVGAWRNQSGGGDPANTLTARPLYTTGLLNSKPGVVFDGIDDFLLFNIADIAQPFKVLLLAQFIAGGTNNVRLMGRGAGSTVNGIGRTSGSLWTSAWTTGLSSTTVTTSPHSLRCTVNSTSSQIFLDGSSIVTGDSGASGMSMLALGAGHSGVAAGLFALCNLFFWGVYDGATTSDADLGALAAGLRSFYGF